MRRKPTHRHRDHQIVGHNAAEAVCSSACVCSGIMKTEWCMARHNECKQACPKHRYLPASP